MEPEVLIALLTLILLELILGIDNVIFLSILSDKLPQHQRPKARNYGLILAGTIRLLLLGAISFILRLDEDVFTIIGRGFSWKDIVLVSGGLFLIYNSTREIYLKVEGSDHEAKPKTKEGFANVLAQILIMDIVFSLDSIITAVGIVKEIWVMYVAVIVTVGVMLFAAKPIGDFVQRHPTIKMLALAFLMLIGFTLVAEGCGVEIPKGYIYFAMAFAFAVDVLQIQMNRKKK